jgi:hypothetical protein
MLTRWALAHVSPDGKDLVALLAGSRLLIIKDWERALLPEPKNNQAPSNSSSDGRSSSEPDSERSETLSTTDDERSAWLDQQLDNLYELTLDIQLGAPTWESIYLAFEGGRVGVVTVYYSFRLMVCQLNYLPILLHRAQGRT